MFTSIYDLLVKDFNTVANYAFSQQNIKSKEDNFWTTILCLSMFIDTTYD